MARGRRRLETYRKRRDASSTPEPSGDSSGASRWREDDEPVFVIQRHDASSDHYDVRLEIDGVLVSWAVPKGPSTDPSDKRLAVRTEDHPLAYADFEGVIPEDEYGGGTVLVWDAGTWRFPAADKEDDDAPSTPKEALEEGHLEVWLEGRKLTGGYAFIHAKVGGDDDNWLMVKMDDDKADARRNPVSTEPKSVLSGRTLEEIAEEEATADDEDDDGDAS